MNNALPTSRVGSGNTTLVFLHFFGGSQLEWAEVCALLSPEYSCVTVDLPGFGIAADVRGYSVAEMSARLVVTLHQLQLKSFVLVGHSMSGKITMTIAAQNFPGLTRCILIAPSPLTPEPMNEKDRLKMLSFRRIRKDAESYLDGITAQPLSGAVRERAINDFIRSSPAAWTAWLEKGSREDLSARIQHIDQPTLVIAGDKDPSLTASVQQKVTMPFLTHGTLEVMKNCGHLPMMEMPAALTRLVRPFVETESN